MKHQTTIDLANPASTAEPSSLQTPPQSSPPPAVPRCVHISPSGRRCASSAYDLRSSLCFRHNNRRKRAEETDHSAVLTRNADSFQSREGIRHSLAELYVLVAQDRISPRRAAVLAFISSMMLRIVDAEAKDEPSVIFDIDRTSPPTEDQNAYGK